MLQTLVCILLKAVLLPESLLALSIYTCLLPQ